MSIRQHEQRSRVNITVDVKQKGQAKKVNLPFKLLALCQLSGQKRLAKLRERDRYQLTADNFNQIMATIKPQLSLLVSDPMKTHVAPIKVNCQFNALADFEPHKLAYQIPSLRKYIAFRHLLKDLKAQLIDQPELKNQFQSLLVEQQHFQQAMAS